MPKLNIYIIFLPFISILLSSIIFLFFQIFLKKKYFINLMTSLIFIFFLIIFFIYKLFPNLNDHQIFYIIFAYLCNSFIFMNFVQGCVSSLQFTILKIIYLNPGISKKEIIKKYNSKHLFEQRIRRLESADIIYKNKSSFFLKKKRILLVLNFFLILKKIFNISN